MRLTDSRRSKRLGDQIQREIAQILEEDMGDPRLSGVTVTGVQLNADLSVARVLYTTSADPAVRQAAAKALDQAAGRLRSLLGKRLHMKFLPELRFAFDSFLEEMVYHHPEAE